MKLSVIVPSYNAGPYLYQCLESLSRQKMTDIEFICIDNCSQDNSREIIAEWAEKDSRFVQVFNEENLGQNGSMNKAFELCQGEYIAECDADDWIATNMYDRLYDFAVLNDCDVVQCGFFDVYKGKRPLERLMFDALYVGHPLSGLYGNDLMQFLGFQPHLQSAIYRKQFLIDNDIRFREDGVFEDTCISFKIRTAANIYGYVPECLYYYRKDNPNSGSATIQNLYAICEQYEEIMRWNDSHDLSLDMYIGAMRYYSYRWNASRIKDKTLLNDFTERAARDFNNDMVFSGFFLTKEDWEDYKRIKEGLPGPK